MLNDVRPQGEPPAPATSTTPDTTPVPESTAVNITGRSYKILADVEVAPDSQGVIFAHGSRFGGHTLFIKDRKLHYVYNFLGIKPEQTFVSPELQPGQLTLGVEFVRESQASTENPWAPRNCMSANRLWPKARCEPRSGRSPWR